MKTVLWISRHTMTEPQLRDLARVLGDTVQVLPYTQTVKQADVLRPLIEQADAIAAVLPVELHADGETPLADAVFTAHTILQRRLERYNEVGVSHYRPWLVLIGDGDESQSMRDLDKAARLLKTESDEKHLSVLCVSVGDADKAEYTSLGKLSPDGQVQYLNDLRFMDFFGWLSRSIQKTSRSLSGEEVKYDPTAEWGEVKTVYKR